MNFNHSAKSVEFQRRVQAFMDVHVFPNEAVYEEQRAGGERWKILPLIEELKFRAKTEGLWNLFLPESSNGAGLSNVDYAPLAEIMGWVPWASQVFNCAAPDTGNMEVLERYGTEEQKAKWLQPLLEGEIRSCFAMTEPEVASSDATNIESRIERDGNHYVINGRKWWSSGAMDPRCRLAIFMGKTDPENPDKYRQQSMILVPLDTPGVKILGPLNVFGFDDAPHGHAEVIYENVRVPVANLLLGEGLGFEIAQGRLGPGRIHHCMRAIGLAERALQLLCQRAVDRVSFGKRLADQGVTRERIAQARLSIDMARLLCLKAAYMMDTEGNKAARAEIAMIKIAGPAAAQQVIDWAIQVFGAAGVSQRTPLAYAFTKSRMMRIADGPDEVHSNAIAKLELSKYSAQRATK